jgi:hypothetical protein
MNACDIHAVRPDSSCNPVKRVISVCEAKDIAVWAIASRRIVRHIGADFYQLICPDAQISEFEAVTAPGWEITGESRVSGNCSVGMIRERVCGENVNRVHWLFQQFIKLNAIAGSELGDRDVVVIWDADTVPLRRLDFVDPASGRIRYYHGKEHHRPYFETIEALCGFGRMIDVSFIAQCLPVRAGWVRDMLREIEDRFAGSYVEAILRHLPGKSGSEFSEYETIGSWVMMHHRDEVVFQEKKRWLRSGSWFFGSRLSGPVAKGLFCLLANRYDYVAIEKWRRPLDLKRISNAVSRFVNQAPKGRAAPPGPHD